MGLPKAICLLVRVWWLLSLSRLLLMTVSAQEMGQPTVSLTIETLPANRTEGTQVEMRCDAENLQGVAYNVSWMTVNPPQTVTLGTMSTKIIGRLDFRRTSTTTSRITEYLTINDTQRADSGQYSCSIRNSTSDQDSVTANVNLSVLYFPNETSPVCSPDGPITVQNDTSLSLQCSSEGGNPAVQMTVFTRYTMTNNTEYYLWNETQTADTVTQTLHLTVLTEDHNASFVCTISSEFFPGMSRYCRIGPLRVTPSSNSSTIPTMETDLVPTSYTQEGPSPSVLFTTVTAQEMRPPTASLTIVTPETDSKEGGRVEMKYEAGNLQGEAYNVEWMTVNPPQNLSLGAMSTRVIGRLKFMRTQTTTSEVTEYLTINDVQRADTGQYSCSIRKGTDSKVAATANVSLSVLYFPNEPSPVCSPNGPITMQSGTSLSLQCSSEGGNPAVQMMTSPNPPNNKYTWEELRMKDTITRFLTVTVEPEDHNALFVCTISSEAFPGMSRDCMMGPISVTPPSDSTIPTMKPAQGTMQTDLVPTSYTQAGPTSSAPSVALIAGVSVGGVTALLLLVILIIICRRRGLCHSQPKSPAPQTQPTPNDDTVFTTNHARHSQPNIYQDTLLQTQGPPAIPDGNIYNDQCKIASPSPGPSWHSSPPLVTERAQSSSIPLYATPHGQTSSSTLRDARDGNLPQSTQQVYSNPAFDSQQSDAGPGPSGGPPRPTARVPPIQGVPIEPKPFKPKPQRVVSSQDGTLDQQDHQLASEAHRTPSARQVHLDNADGNHPSSSTNKGPVYATVMKREQNKN